MLISHSLSSCSRVLVAPLFIAEGILIPFVFNLCMIPS